MNRILFRKLLVSLIMCSVPMSAATQAGITVPDRFGHAEPFIRALEAGGVEVHSISQSTLEASFGGGQKAAFITTDKGVVEIIVFPGATDAEQLSITYTKWHGNQHHFHIAGPTFASRRMCSGNSRITRYIRTCS